MTARVRRMMLTAVIAAASIALVLPPSAAMATDPDRPTIPRAPADQAEPQQAPEGSRLNRMPGAPDALDRPAPRSQISASEAIAPGVPSITVDWVHTSDARFRWAGADGGSPITGYTVQLLQNGAMLDEVTDWTDAAVWITDLDPGGSYEIRVAAQNAVGLGEFGSATFTTPLTTVDRRFGANRVETAVAVAADAFPEAPVPAAFLANGLDFPDALAAAAAAGALGGPVLLTEPKKLPGPVLTELSALSPEYLIVAGGPASVSDAVGSSAASTSTVDAFRLFGANRFGTAADVASLWGDGSDVVYLANGLDFPDALAGAAAAGVVGAPVLLTETNRLPGETATALRALAPTQIIVLGGTGAVSNAVVAAAVASTGIETSTQRLSGANRYDTAVAISKATFGDPGVPVAYVASGASFADALAGAAAAGHLNGPVLLTESKTVPSSVLNEIARLRPQRIVVLGGPTIVTDSVMKTVRAAADS